MTIYTVGHSTHSLEALVALLRPAGVTMLVDVRTVPRSRHNPQFNHEALEVDLPARGIAYQHLPALGGLRHPRPDSPNTGWDNPSFRGYADYMQTAEFREGLRQLLGLAAVGAGNMAVMCAEAVPWRCHRSLLADALTARGVAVAHLLPDGRVQPHRPTPFLRVAAMPAGEVRLTYPKP